jgi:hypothetical protein
MQKGGAGWNSFSRVGDRTFAVSIFPNVLGRTGLKNEVLQACRMAAGVSGGGRGKEGSLGEDERRRSPGTCPGNPADRMGPRIKTTEAPEEENS